MVAHRVRSDGGRGSAAAGVHALSRFFVNDGTLGDTLLKVSQLACDVAPADMAASPCWSGQGPHRRLHRSRGTRDRRGPVQIGKGPCLDAFRHQETYRIDSTAAEQRWPELAAMAAAHGIIATLSLPLVARDVSLGALNLYSRNRIFDDQASDRASVFAEQAAIVLANTQVYWDAQQLSENLTQAMDSRSTIDYAIGILLANGATTPDDAFQILVRASQRENRKLRDIAARWSSTPPSASPSGDEVPSD